jgi:hypothetical protein
MADEPDTWAVPLTGDGFGLAPPVSLLLPQPTSTTAANTPKPLLSTDDTLLSLFGWAYGSKPRRKAVMGAGESG